jgi:hypothetical protein
MAHSARTAETDRAPDRTRRTTASDKPVPRRSTIWYSPDEQPSISVDVASRSAWAAAAFDPPSSSSANQVHWLVMICSARQLWAANADPLQAADTEAAASKTGQNILNRILVTPLPKVRTACRMRMFGRSRREDALLRLRNGTHSFRALGSRVNSFERMFWVRLHAAGMPSVERHLTDRSRRLVWQPRASRDT